MINIFIIGANGRMGKSIRKLIEQSNDINFIGGLDKEEQKSSKIVTHLSSFPETTDVVIDFSSPEATMRYLKMCVAQEKAMVIGTTGFSEDQNFQIEDATTKIPIFISPNMSIGVNILFKLTEKLMSLINPSYDIEVIEMHHNKKKDAPSGTARRLVDIIASSREFSLITHGRDGNIGERKKEEIGVHSVRAGDIVGDHRIIVAGNNEMLELSHRAITRETLSAGALAATRFIIKQSHGLYSMDELLKL